MSECLIPSTHQQGGTIQECLQRVHLEEVSMELGACPTETLCSGRPRKEKPISSALPNPCIYHSRFPHPTSQSLRAHWLQNLCLCLHQLRSCDHSLLWIERRSRALSCFPEHTSTTQNTFYKVLVAKRSVLSYGDLILSPSHSQVESSQAFDNFLYNSSQMPLLEWINAG